MKYGFFKKGVAVAHGSEAMEADTISKHGSYRPKSHTSRNNNLFMFLCTALVVGFFTSIVLSGCKDGDGGDNEDSGGLSASDFFSIEDATYKNGKLPTGSAAMISDISISNQTVINGGSTIVSFSTSEAIKTAYVSIKGSSGYYEYTIPASMSQSNTTYNYYIVLLMSQTLTFSEEFIIRISVVSADGSVSAAMETDEVTVQEVGTGMLQVSLSWDQNDDVDLHFLESDGNHIFYGNPISDSERDIEFEFLLYLADKYTQQNTSTIPYGDWEAILDFLDKYIDESLWETLDYEEEWSLFMKDLVIEGAFLDLDSNPACDIDGINNENITYTSAPPNGTYYVAVDLYEKCGMSTTPGAKYSVTVRYNGEIFTISDKQIGKFNATFEGSYDNPSKFHVIGGFSINNQRITKVDVTTNPFANIYAYSLSAVNKQKKAFRSLKKF